MFVDLKYVQSLEKEVDELHSDKIEFSKEYDLLLQECLGKYILCVSLMSIVNFDNYCDMACKYLDKIKECERLEFELSKQHESLKNKPTNLLNHSLESKNFSLKKIVAQFSKLEAQYVALELKYQNHVVKSEKHGHVLKDIAIRVHWCRPMRKEEIASWDGGKSTWGGQVRVFGTVPVSLGAQEIAWGRGEFLSRKGVVGVLCRNDQFAPILRYISWFKEMSRSKGFITLKASVTIYSRLVNSAMQIWRLLSKNLHALLKIFRETTYLRVLIDMISTQYLFKKHLHQLQSVSWKRLHQLKHGYGKAKRSTFKTKTVLSSKGRLHLLHMDLCGPMRVKSINGKKYVLVIV
nr:ribonuclease H-like domain-containing protein [Tanacetum cinerariifolium]